jgi:metallo-beta-lactamase family protein
MHFTRSVEESIALNRIQSGAIIISASGMCEAGRIKHHLRHRLPNSADTVLIVGYQARGTLGRRLVERAGEVRIFGDPVPVRADIEVLNGLSAHADRAALLDWARAFKRAPSRTFVVHGEEAASSALKASLTEEFGWAVHAPDRGEVIEL